MTIDEANNLASKIPNEKDSEQMKDLIEQCHKLWRYRGLRVCLAGTIQNSFIVNALGESTASSKNIPMRLWDQRWLHKVINQPHVKELTSRYSKFPLFRTMVLGLHGFPRGLQLFFETLMVKVGVHTFSVWTWL
jgi:hypothetical protein